MANEFSALSQLYPELKKFALETVDNATSDYEPEEVTGNELVEPLRVDELPKSSAQSQVVVNITNRSMQKAKDLPPLKNKSWVRSLNKITSGLVSGADNNAQLLMFIGVSPRVGTTTVSYYCARLLASYDLEQASLFITINITQNTISADFEQLLNREITIDAYFERIVYANFSEMVIDLPEKESQSASVLFALTAILQRAKKEYRWITLDVPPQGKVPNLMSFFHLANGVILVARSGDTRLPAMNALVSDLEECGANIIGAILNYRRFPIPRSILKYI